jgi:hypothetical protein
MRRRFDRLHTLAVQNGRTQVGVAAHTFARQGKYKLQKGRNILIYDTQVLSAPALRRGAIVPSQLDTPFQTRQTTVKQVRIVPQNGYYFAGVVYEEDAVPRRSTPSHVLA